MSKLEINNFSQKVYHLCSQIPEGKVSTYKLIAIASFGNSSYSRTVGKILSRCECEMELNSHDFFCERVHCYRVINSDFSLGGFTPNRGGEIRIDIKKRKLTDEGVIFDKKGYLLKDLRERIIFKNFHE